MYYRIRSSWRGTQSDRCSPSTWTNPWIRARVSNFHVIIVRILADISCDESQEILCGEKDHPRGNQDTLERDRYHYGLFDARVKPYKCATPTRSRILNPAALVSRLSPTVYAALVVILSIPSMSAVLEAKTTTSGSQHRFEPRDEPSEDLRQLFLVNGWCYVERRGAPTRLANH